MWVAHNKASGLIHPTGSIPPFLLKPENRLNISNAMPANFFNNREVWKQFCMTNWVRHFQLQYKNEVLFTLGATQKTFAICLAQPPDCWLYHWTLLEHCSTFDSECTSRRIPTVLLSGSNLYLTVSRQWFQPLRHGDYFLFKTGRNIHVHKIMIYHIYMPGKRAA